MWDVRAFKLGSRMMRVFIGPIFLSQSFINYVFIIILTQALSITLRKTYCVAVGHPMENTYI
jgi:hypothetical protein